MTSATAPRRIYLLAFLGLVGAALGVALSIHYYDLHAGTAGFKSYCNVNEAVNCDAVALSPYSQLLPGFPLSSFVVGWFVTFTVIALLALSAAWRKEAVRALTFMSGLAVVAGGILFILMSQVIHAYCMFCLFVDLVSLAALVTALSMRSAFAGKGFDGARWPTLAGITVVSLLISVLALKGMFEGDQLEASTENVLVSQVLATPPMPISITPDTATMGPENAPITIAEFSDFQCPFCRLGAITLKQLQARYPGKLRIVFKNYPLNSACNSSTQHSMHPFACEAAKVVLCATKQGKFEPVYETIFERQPQLGSGTSIALAKELGVDGAQLDACLSASETAMALTRETGEGGQLGLKSTPTFFINGHRMDGAYPISAWIKIIDALLKASDGTGR